MNAEREEFIGSIHALVEQLHRTATFEHPLDVDQTLRLISVGVQHCLAGLATLLEENDGRQKPGAEDGVYE